MPYSPGGKKFDKAAWREANREKLRLDAREYRLRNLDSVREKAKAYAIKNKERIAEYQKEYKKRPESKLARARWMKSRRDIGASGYLSHSFRCRITKILNYRRSKDVGFSRTKSLSFIDFSALKTKLESEFRDGWSWENWGSVWHIDHFWPCRIFDLTNPIHIQACFSLGNMRAISAKDNLFKSDSIPIDIPFPFMIEPVLKKGEYLSFGNTLTTQSAINE